MKIKEMGSNWHEDLNSRTPSPLEQLRIALDEHGLVLPPSFQIDGKIYRFPSPGAKSPKDDAGWVVANPDNPPWGSFGDHRAGLKVKWRAMRDVEDYDDVPPLPSAKSTATQDVALVTIKEIFRKAVPCTDVEQHPYLAKKKVTPHKIKITSDSRLLIPLFNEHGELITAQFIDATGKKRFHPGASVKGGFFIFEKNEGNNKPLTVYITEGYATGASVFEATNSTVVAAFSTSNLLTVTEIVVKKYPDSEIIIVADNDESGAGRKAANEAAEITKVSVIMPPNIGDANDYINAGGDFKALVRTLLDPRMIEYVDAFRDIKPIEWLIEGWIEKNTFIMMHSPASCGKSFVGLDMSLHIASDKTEWMGCAVIEGRKRTIYLVGEGYYGFPSRLAAWQNYNEINYVNGAFWRGNFDLNTPAGLRNIDRNLSLMPETPHLIVIDTLNTYFLGDENKADDAKKMTDVVKYLIDKYNTSVLITHHTGWAQDAQHRGRGSSAWRAAVDMEIRLKKDKDNGISQLEQTKTRNSEPAEPIPFTLEKAETGEVDPKTNEKISSLVMVYSDSPQGQSETKRLDLMYQIINNGWIRAGKLKPAGMLYIPKDAVRDELVSRGINPKSVRHYLNPSNTNKIIGKLIENRSLEPYENGWKAIGADLIEHMRMSDNLETMYPR